MQTVKAILSDRKKIAEKQETVNTILGSLVFIVLACVARLVSMVHRFNAVCFREMLCTPNIKFP